MNKFHFRRSLRWQLPVALVVALGATFTPLAATSSAATPPAPQAEGLVCAAGSTADFRNPPKAPLPTNPSFVLTAQDGYITTPDGNSIYMWGYAVGSGSYQDPGPVLCVNEGDTVTITLRNTLPVATSVQFPGMTGVLANGSPTQPDASSDSLATSAPADTGSKPNFVDPADITKVTYSFVADHPGTFLYESGSNPQFQVQMGLAGAIVVRPRLGNPCLTGTVADGTVCTPSRHVYDDTGASAGMATDPTSCGNAGGLACFSSFAPTKEYLHVLSEIDPMLHEAAESGTYEYDMTAYKARYFFINGRSFPDTVSPNFAAHLPSQPYGALVHIQPRNTQQYLTGTTNPNPDYNPDPALVRYLNTGPVDYPFHPHSNNERQIGYDAHPLINSTNSANPTDASVDRYGIVVPPGATIETEFAWVDQQNWDPTKNPISVAVPDQQARTEGQYWSGSPYLGWRQDLSTGKTQYNECGEMYQVAHSHALFQATNYGASMGGMLTMIRIDPPNSFAQHAHCTTGN